jgi:uncharacterized protein (TIGR00730 family)
MAGKIQSMPARLSSVAVYCGSNPGNDPAFAAAAASLGRLLARRDIRLVYGGATVGLMGVVADAVLAGGGAADGVITRPLAAKEIAHPGLTSLRVVETMHERKAAMADASDAFVMLPGGYGTLDEFFEVLTWTQLGIHDKPCGVLDVAGFFTPLRELIDGAVAAGFVHPAHRDTVIMESDPDRLLDRLASWAPVTVGKWLDRSERLRLCRVVPSVFWAEVDPALVLPHEPARLRHDAALPVTDVHGAEPHRAGCVEEPAVAGLQDGEPRPAERGVEVEFAGPARRMPGTQQVVGVPDGECAVARPHQLLGGGRRRPAVQPPAAGVVAIAQTARAPELVHADILPKPSNRPRLFSTRWHLWVAKRACCKSLFA